MLTRDSCWARIAAKKPSPSFAKTRKHPDQWFVHTGLARMYGAQGKFDDATKEIKAALAAAPGDQKSYLDGLVRQLEAQQDIN
jgi:hypothetical protein